MVEQTRTNESEAGAYSLDTTFECLARADYRRLLRRLLDEAPEPVSQGELAETLAAHAHDESPEAVTEAHRREALATLHHTHLPTLAAAGLVERDSDDETVAVTDHPALRDSDIVEAVEGEATASDASLDTLFGALTNARSRAVLDVLSHQFGRIHVETLARELGTRDRDLAESEIPAADLERILARLYHVDLPHLSDAGLIEYDTAERTVAYEGHPDLRVPWMHSVFEGAFRSSLTGETEPSGIGEIEDRERVISFGQSLCDRADDELFCMFTDTGLLEGGCLTRIRDAARERDVDVYLGTRDPAVRAYVEENVPEVVLWEPNTDWLNLPAAGDRVGRLVVADREAAMLGTLLEEETDGVHHEQAIVGEGEHNTLVTMLCQLLGPHLEEIDEGTEDIETQLPL